MAVHSSIRRSQRKLRINLQNRLQGKIDHSGANDRLLEGTLEHRHREHAERRPSNDATNLTRKGKRSHPRENRSRQSRPRINPGSGGGDSQLTKRQAHTRIISSTNPKRPLRTFRNADTKTSNTRSRPRPKQPGGRGPRQSNKGTAGDPERHEFSCTS
ncbi:hypothetical protein Bca4012_072303 [Brassica carinata]